MEAILAQIAGRGDCRLLPPTGPVRVPAGLLAPPDLSRFHDQCGGVVLFEHGRFPWHVAVAEGIVPASPRLLGADMAARVAVDYPDDLTNTCYIIADSGRDASTDPHIVIDMHPDRAGRCYLAFWDTYGVVGEMPIVALGLDELLGELLALDGNAATTPARYGDAYEPELPWQPHRIELLDATRLQRWRDDMTRAVASAMSTFQERMGYPPGDNRIGPPIAATQEPDDAQRQAGDDLAMFYDVVGDVRLPDIGNGWFVHRPLPPPFRIGPPYNVDCVRFASDGGGTAYAVPASQSGPVLRLREVAEIDGLYQGDQVHVSAPHLRAFLAGLYRATRRFTHDGGITDL